MSNPEKKNLYTYLNDGTTPAPFFEKVALEERSDDGYWISAVDINGDGKPDLVTSDLAQGKIAWYDNSTWKKRVIAEFPSPVAIDHRDIAGHCRNDLVLSHDFGGCVFNCGPNDGKISWLENPGRYYDDKPRTVRSVGDLGVLKPIALTLYDVPDDVFANQPWKERLVDQKNFVLVHDMLRGKFPGQGGNEQLDSLVVSSAEGANWYYFDSASGQFKMSHITDGDQTYAKLGFKGCSNALPGRIEDDPFSPTTQRSIRSTVM